jgi:hypothetical protein
MTEDDFRALALALDGAVEASHMNHPDIRANGRIFATLHGNGTSGMVKVTPEQQAALMKDAPKAFSPSAGAWGRQGCTTVTLAAAKTPATRGALLLAYQAVMAMSAPRAKAKKKARK